ncbi:MAG: WbqC family protein [bacterium]|nr:WbqC family protein [bacterium]
MILSAHQPEYLPYLGFFYKMAKADTFVLADHLQFSKKGFQNRNRIKTAQGSPWLTVPVILHGIAPLQIREVRINNATPWAKKHWQLIYFNYKKAPFFDKYSGFFEKLYSKKWEKLADLNEEIIYYLAKELGITTGIVKSSDYGFTGKKTDFIIELSQKFGADTYLSGMGGKNYMDLELLKKNNVTYVFSDFKHPVYPQRFEPFVENLSAIDLLFNCGPESLEMLKNPKI